MEKLAELDIMLYDVELEAAGDEDEQATVDAGRLVIDGGDGVLGLLEREGSVFGDDVGNAFDLLPFKGEHGILLIEIG